LKERELKVEGPSTTISSFLLRFYPQFKADIFIECGAVGLIRNKVRYRVYKSSTVVKHGDNVTVADDPPSDPCKHKLDTIPTTEFLDYAMPNAGEEFVNNMMELLALKKDGNGENGIRTFVLRGIRTLAEFIDAINNGRGISKPIRDMIIVSHASPKVILLFLREGKRGEEDEQENIDYEDLQFALQLGILKLDPRSLEPRPIAEGQRIPPYFIINGCTIGQEKAKPFLLLLKEALGGKVKVVGFKYSERVSRTEPPLHGMLGSLEYRFSIFEPTEINDKNRNKLIQDFSDRDLRLFDNNRVPHYLWQKWIPDKALNRTGGHRFDVDVRLPVNNQTIHLPREVRFEHFQTNLFKKDGTIGNVKDGSEGEMKEAVKFFLSDTSAGFQLKHPYPKWVRDGLDSFDEWIDSWSFGDFKYDSRSKTITGNMSRHQYIVRRPVVDTDNSLFCNFYPLKGEPFIQLRVGDKRFFTVV
jgi:hypothetical protein